MIKSIKQISRSANDKRASEQANKNMNSSRHWHAASKWLVNHLLLVLLLLVSLVHKDSNCLKISSIEIPGAVWNGSQVTFVCNHELAPDDQLYSVKWYKNYVEFYRFQPQPQPQPQLGGLDSATTTPASEPLAVGWQAQQSAGSAQVGRNSLNLNQPQPGEPAAAAGARHEFELDGINLDLSKSNATHVHLNQVNLSSAATFKCEVSADSPTFATVSAERQMKVYVLPKQKLALVDNSNSAPSGQQANTVAPFQATTTTTTLKPQAGLSGVGQNNEPPPPPARIQQNNGKQLIYQLNDLINFTCVAGASRPGARLTWLVNDQLVPLAPAAAASGQNQSSPSSGKLFALNIDEQTLRRMPNDLLETRSTLTLRLQAQHLKMLRKQATGSSQLNPMAHSTSVLPIKLSCLSQLRVEFSSETSLMVSNGKAPVKVEGQRRRNNSARGRDDTGRPLPEASSWIDGGGETAPPADLDHTRRRDNPIGPAGDDQAGEADLLSFRWPPPAPQNGRQRFRSAPLASEALISDQHTWLGRRSHEQSGDQPAMGQANQQQQQQQQQDYKHTRGRYHSIWTQRQLRAQADHIDQLIARTRPNELEIPHIEAKSIRRDPFSSSESSFPPTTSTQLPATNTDQSGGGDADDLDGDGDDEERTTPVSPSIFIASSQLGLHDQPPPLPPAGGEQSKSRELNKDYELNELVNFTCHSVMAGDTSGDRLSRPSNPLYSVHVSWFLNDQEIIGNQVNAFDGERFYQRTNSEEIYQPNGTNSSTGVGNLIMPATTNAGKQHRTSNWLLVEFTQSLLQLKEFNLKCRTSIEQPLIEYESVQILSLATSPFIQANQEQLMGQKFRPSMYNTRDAQRPGASQTNHAGRYQSSIGLNNFDYSNSNSNNNNNPSQRHRNNVIRMRQSQQTRSHSTATSRQQINANLFVVALTLTSLFTSFCALGPFHSPTVV